MTMLWDLLIYSSILYSSHWISENVLIPKLTLITYEEGKKLTYNFYLLCFYLLMVVKWNSIITNTPNIWTLYKENFEIEKIYDIFGGDNATSSYYRLHIFHYIYELFNSLKKKNVEYTLHHLVTLTLIYKSTNLQKLGVIIMYIHDHGDALLSFGKCYSHSEKYITKYKLFFKTMANTSFGLFICSFAYYRLYWFLTFTIDVYKYPFIGYPELQQLQKITILLFTILYLLQVYWFYFILTMLKKIINKDYTMIEGH